MTRLRDIPLRDLIALEVLPAIVGRGEKNSRDQVHMAYDVADAMLMKMAVREHEIDTLKRRVEKAETTVSTLLNMDANFAPRVALLEIWEFLGTKDQTATMQMIRDAFPELRHD